MLMPQLNVAEVDVFKLSVFSLLDVSLLLSLIYKHMFLSALEKGHQFGFIIEIISMSVFGPAIDEWQ